MVIAQLCLSNRYGKNLEFHPFYKICLVYYILPSLSFFFWNLVSPKNFLFEKTSMLLMVECMLLIGILNTGVCY